MNFEFWNNKLLENNPKLKLVEIKKFKTNKKLFIKCEEDTHEIFSVYSSNLSKVKIECPKCRIKNDLHITKWDKESIKIWMNENAKNYELLDVFMKNQKTNIEIWCKKENHPSYKTTFFDFKNGSRCKHCSLEETNRERWDLERLKSYLKNKGFYIKEEDLCHFKNTKSKITICDDEGYKYYTFIENLQNNRNPRKFYKNNIYTIDNINLYLSKNKRNIVCISDKFLGSSKNMKWKYIGDTKIKEEYRIWETSWNSIYSGNNNPKLKISKGEKIIQDYLNSNNIEFIPQYKNDECKNINSLYFDIFIPIKNLIIEFQGELHEEKIRIKDRVLKNFGGLKGLLSQTKRDIIKKRYCRKNNIKLIEIWYYEKHQINKILKYALGI